MFTQSLFNAMAEAVWPTRCIVCDVPGEVLCARCASQLPFIDQWKACPVCGAPFGVHQCTECNTFSLREVGLRYPPFKRCVSAVTFTDEVARIMRGRKDAGERRLDANVAFYIASVIPPEWIVSYCALCPVPSTKHAIRQRGFDHGWALAQECGTFLGLPAVQLLQSGMQRDQRHLSRSDRFKNMVHAFAPLGIQNLPPVVILIDDVYTTGATLMAAASALRRAGVRCVFAATFAHVYQN